MKVLLLHGFTSSVDVINGLVPGCVERGWEYRLPVLRGHGTRPEDLVGVTWQDWLDDARAALLELKEDVLIVGLSMGGLLALNLAAEHPGRVRGVVSAATCLRFRSPLIHALPLIARRYEYWQGSPDYADPELVKLDTNYPRFPVKTFVGLFSYCQVVDELLLRVEAPLCVLAGKNDPVSHPEAARRIHARCRSRHKELHWFGRTRHELFRDVEREAAIATVFAFAERASQDRGDAVDRMAARPS